MLDVCLLGTSGMMPLPGRALTALMTRFNGSSLLVDCGEGTQVSIREKGWSMHDIDTICITHIHGDHVSGLPGLLLSMGNTERTAPLQVIGPRGVRRVLESLLVIAPGLPFEIRCQELTEKVHHIELNGSELTAFRVSHTVPCYGYCQVIHRAGRFDVEKAKTNQVPMAVWSRLQKTDTVILDGREYTSDMAENSDLFICEGMYGEPEMSGRAKENKHMTFTEAAELARQAGVSELWLTHFSPSLVRPDFYMKEVRKIFPCAKPGKDRKTKILNFDED